MKKSEKKFYKTIIQIEVLSEEPYDNDDPAAIGYDCDEGDCVGTSKIVSQKVLTGKQMANALYDAGSEPGFFQLNDDGTTD